MPYYHAGCCTAVPPCGFANSLGFVVLFRQPGPRRGTPAGGRSRPDHWRRNALPLNSSLGPPRVAESLPCNPLGDGPPAPAESLGVPPDHGPACGNKPAAGAAARPAWRFFFSLANRRPPQRTSWKGKPSPTSVFFFCSNSHGPAKPCKKRDPRQRARESNVVGGNHPRISWPRAVPSTNFRC